MLLGIRLGVSATTTQGLGELKMGSVGRINWRIT